MVGTINIFEKLRVWFSTISTNIKKQIPFFQLDLLQTIRCQTSTMIGTIS